MSEQMSDEALELFVDRQVAELMGRELGPRRARSCEAIDLSRSVSKYAYPRRRGLRRLRLLRSDPRSDRGAGSLFLADGLEGRYAASPVALRLAKRIRKEAAARRGRDIELEDMEKYELLRFLDQVAFDRMLEAELLELRAMLRGERRPEEQPPSA